SADNFVGGGLGVIGGGAFGANGNPIETSVDNFEITSTGGVYVLNDGALEIGGVSALLNGVQNTGGGIEIYAQSPLTVTEDVVELGGDDIALAALGSSGDDNLVVQNGANVRSETGNGNVLLVAGNDLVIEDGSTIEAEGSGNVGLYAGKDYTNELLTDEGNGFADIIMQGAGSSVVADTGDVTIYAADEVQLTSVTTNGNANIQAERGAIIDALNTASANVTANQVLFDGYLGVGSASNAVDTVASNLEADGNFGGVYISNTGDLTIGDGDAGDGISGIVNQLGDIVVTSSDALTVNENIHTNNNGNINLTALGADPTDDITVNTGVSVSTASGDVTLNSGNDVLLNGTAELSAGGSGSVNVDADQDITMSSDSLIETKDGNITLVAGNDANLATVNADSDSNSVVVGDVLIQAGGAVTDTNAGAANIIADQLEIQSANGIATDADVLETEVNYFVAQNTTSGGIFVENTGALVIGNGVSGTINGVSNAGTSSIQIATNSPLSIDEAVEDTNGNDITLAAYGNTAVDNVVVNADVAASGGDGSVIIAAGNNVSMGNNVTVSAENAGDVSLLAGEDLSDSTINQDGNASADILMGGNSVVSVDAGVALLDARDNIQLGVVTTGTGGTARIIAREGAIIDTNGFDANVIGDQLLLSAEDGVGSFADMIDTQVSTLEAHGNQGGVFVANQGALTLEDFDAAVGTAGEAVTAVGDEIVVTTASPMTINDDVVQSGGLDISLIAFGSADTDDITINADVSATGGAGDIFIVAGDDVIMNAGSTVSAENDGD
ncbi:MAG: hypothetical protein KC649_04995, partial [Candidatus Omnitrophica bacterium]|nr:hypothetical protein [Candidatus Omnitrophota bacterium]